MHPTTYTDLSTPDANIARALYLTLQPVMYLEDPMSLSCEEHRASGFLSNSAELHILAGLPDEPPCSIAICRDPAQTMAYLSDVRSRRPALRLWYDGMEMLGEIKGDPRPWLTDLLNASDEDDDDPDEESEA